MSWSPDYSKINGEKFRIFVDGSYNDIIGMGAIGCCFPKKYKGQKIRALRYDYSKLFQTSGSVNMEIMAIKKGLEIIKQLVEDNPFLKDCVIRIKSDCIFVLKYILKGQKMEQDIHDYNEDNLLLMSNIRKELNEMKEQGYNIKISYIPKKFNFAHHYCYIPLRKKFEKISKNTSKIF